MRCECRYPGPPPPPRLNDVFPSPALSLYNMDFPRINSLVRAVERSYVGCHYVFRAADIFRAVTRPGARFIRLRARVRSLSVTFSSAASI